MEIGDRFQFLNEVGGGVILELERGRILVSTDDDREFWVDQLEIIPEDVYVVPAEARKPVESPSTEWAIGAKVGYLDEPGGGIIVNEGDQGFLILDNDGFERWFNKSKLVLVQTDLEQELKSSKTENKDRLVRRHNIPRPKVSPILEVDLHIHELLEFDSHLSDYEKLTHQLNVAKHQLEKARKGNYNKVILIHGVGKGVLKQKIAEMLAGMDRVEFYDASLQKYGTGATEVVFR